MGTPATTETAKLVQFDGTDEMWPAFSIRLDVAIGKLGLDGITSGTTPRPASGDAMREWDTNNRKLFNLLAERVNDDTLLSIAGDVTRGNGKGFYDSLVSRYEAQDEARYIRLIGEIIAMRIETPEDTSRVVTDSLRLNKQLEVGGYAFSDKLMKAILIT